MNRIQGVAAPVAMAVGAFLIVEGIWGMFSPVVFGVLSTNTLHATIHIALGLVGIYAARTRGARPWCMYVGMLVLVVGILRFVPGASGVVVSLLNVNVAVAILNIVVGVVLVVVARMSPASSRG